MDAFIQIAIMAKAQRVFEGEGTFLSFPALVPLSYAPEQLSFGTGPDTTARDKLELSEFARVANHIPRGVVAAPGEDEYLWEVYRDVLNRAQFASGNMSAGDQVRYARAVSFLYTTAPDGTRAHNEVLIRYNQCRDAHIVALEDYKNQQLTAELSQDATVQAKWRDEDEPRLRSEVGRLLGEWQTVGRKEEVEAAQQIEQQCRLTAPLQARSEWQASFITDVDTETDGNNTQFAVTGLSPFDFVDGSWPRFTLSGAEMAHLVQNAPAELREVFDGSRIDADIVRVSFEYCSVAVSRPWFRSALFRSRIWRLGDGEEPVSDGGNPGTGRCPAYISAMVFARNVTVERRQGPGAVSARPMLQSVRILDPSVVRVGRRSGGGSHPSQPMIGFGREHRLNAVRTAKSSVDGKVAGQPGMRLKREAFGAMRRPVFKGVVNAAPPTAPSAAPISTVAVPASEVMVLAFICRRVPRCPDPDPNLNWT